MSPFIVTTKRPKRQGRDLGLIARGARKPWTCNGDGSASHRHHETCRRAISVGEAHVECVREAPGYRGGSHVSLACAVAFYGWLADECVAVATMDKARHEVYEIVSGIRHQPGDAARLSAAVPGSGGTVGPLPDGTLIEVTPTPISDIVNRLIVRFSKPGEPIADEGASGVDWIAAFNARETSQ